MSKDDLWCLIADCFISEPLPKHFDEQRPLGKGSDRKLLIAPSQWIHRKAGEIAREIHQRFKGTPYCSVDIQALGSFLGVAVKSEEMPDYLTGLLLEPEDCNLPEGRFEAVANACLHLYRQRIVVAHEIAHYIVLRAIKLLEEDYDNSKRVISLLKGERPLEGFCDALGDALILPKSYFNPKVLSHLRRSKRTVKGGFEDVPSAPNGGLGFELLSKLCHHFKVPISNMIRALDRTLLINQLETAILRISPSRNRYGGGSIGLRIYDAARPEWSYIITNRILSKLEAKELERAYIENHEGIVSGSLEVRFRQHEGSEWTKMDLNAQFMVKFFDDENKIRNMLVWVHIPKPHVQGT